MKSIAVVLLLCLTRLFAQENKPFGLAANEQETPTGTKLGVASPAPPLSKEDVLSIKDGQFFLDGKPFVEISFNKFDLFWQLYDQLAAGQPLERNNPMVQAQERALRNLHELGFRTIRIFALPWGPEGPASYADPEKRRRLYAALDKTLELCDVHDIRVVWSLGAVSFTDTKLDPAKGWVYGEEQERELVANPESRSRKLLYRYIDETVARYKQRKAVVMWEISNEVTLQADIGDGNRVYNGERMPSLKEVAGFFDDVAKRIKSADPMRLVNSGGSNMRESQWHLYLGQGWKKDTFEEQFKCFELLYADSAVDVIDIHSYPNGKPGYLITDDHGKEMWLDNKGYMSISKRLHKPLMIGELGLQPAPKTQKETWAVIPDYFESFDDKAAAKPWLMKCLNDVVEARVPLTYWWCYQADRSNDPNNRQRLDIDRDRNPELVACIADANKRLQATVTSVAQPTEFASPARSKFRVLALAEPGGHHIAFTEAAKPWLKKCGEENAFEIDYINSAAPVTETLLAQYQLVLQLDFVPYGWKPEAMAAFRSYIEQGKGGWVGLHHATLLGEFDGHPMWPWFSEFMGKIRFKNYIPTFASGTVRIEDKAHPCMKDVPETFVIAREEWYTWDRSPRPNVRVLASVDEATYAPSSEIKMGDHPVIWTNEGVRARNVYIFMGHGPDLLENKAFTMILRNAILWAAGK